MKKVQMMVARELEDPILLKEAQADLEEMKRYNDSDKSEPNWFQVVKTEVVFDEREPVFMESCKLNLATYVDLHMKVQLFHKWNGDTENIA